MIEWKGQILSYTFYFTVSPSIYKLQNLRALLTNREFSPYLGNLINRRTTQAMKGKLQNWYREPKWGPYQNPEILRFIL